MVAAMPAGVRCAVIPPAPVPYREPLFAGLAARPSLALRVIYQAGRPAGWDQAEGWFPDRHAYDAVHLRALQRERAGGTPVVWPRGLERALRSFRPAVIVVWEYGPAALRTWAWGARRRLPFVIFSENTPAIDERLPAAQLRLHRWLAGRATGFIAASSAARERFVSLGAAPDAVEVSLQSFDPAPIRAAVARRVEGPVRFLTVARLVPDKNVGGLIEAFARSGLTADEAELRVVGTGPLEGELRALAARLGVPAQFSGYTAPDDLPAAYAAADVFVLPSLFEPFGVVVREAVAAGLPVICSPTVGAAGDVAVAGRNALLPDPPRPAELAEALARVARDERLRLDLARESREIDRENGIERSVDAFERAVARAAMYGA
jgi:glycosyltransferase involved in cell wall biosynthesis